MLPSLKEYQPEASISEDIWTALGLPSRGTSLFDLVCAGIHFEFLDRLANHLQIKREVIAKAICVSPQTLARRAKAGRLSTIESDRLVSLIAVFQEALVRLPIPAVR